MGLHHINKKTVCLLGVRCCTAGGSCARVGVEVAPPPRASISMETESPRRWGLLLLVVVVVVVGLQCSMNAGHMSSE